MNVSMMKKIHGVFYTLVKNKQEKIEFISSTKKIHLVVIVWMNLKCVKLTEISTVLQAELRDL